LQQRFEVRRALALTAICGATGYAVLRTQTRACAGPAPGIPFALPAQMRAQEPAAGPVQLLPVGRVAPGDLAFLCEVVRRVYLAPCQVRPELLVPAGAWSRTRAQLDADAMLGLLVDRFDAQSSRMLAITELDMFAAGRPYVFGYGHLRDRVAIVSTARLGGSAAGDGRAPDPKVVRERLYKAAVHELGHTAGNPHCAHVPCLMAEVADLDALDALPRFYCAECLARTRHELRVAPAAPQAQFALGAALLRRRQYDRAVASLLRAARDEPANAIYLNDLGVALLRRGERGAAMRAFERARRLRPDLPEPVYNLQLVGRLPPRTPADAAQTASGGGVAGPR
jgi:archaemetzincin